MNVPPRYEARTVSIFGLDIENVLVVVATVVFCGFC